MMVTSLHASQDFLSEFYNNDYFFDYSYINGTIYGGDDTVQIDFCRNTRRNFEYPDTIKFTSSQKKYAHIFEYSDTSNTFFIHITDSAYARTGVYHKLDYDSDGMILSDSVFSETAALPGSDLDAQKDTCIGLRKYHYTHATGTPRLQKRVTEIKSEFTPEDSVLFGTGQYALEIYRGDEIITAEITRCRYNRIWKVNFSDGRRIELWHDITDIRKSEQKTSTPYTSSPIAIAGNQIYLSEGNYVMEIFSLNGTKLKQISGTRNVIDLKSLGLAKGLYHFRIVQGNVVFVRPYLLN